MVMERHLFSSYNFQSRMASKRVAFGKRVPINYAALLNAYGKVRVGCEKDKPFAFPKSS